MMKFAIKAWSNNIDCWAGLATDWMVVFQIGQFSQVKSLNYH